MIKVSLLTFSLPKPSLDLTAVRKDKEKAGPELIVFHLIHSDRVPNPVSHTQATWLKLGLRAEMAQRLADLMGTTGHPASEGNCPTCLPSCSNTDSSLLQLGVGAGWQHSGRSGGTGVL